MVCQVSGVISSDDEAMASSLDHLQQSHGAHRGARDAGGPSTSAPFLDSDDEEMDEGEEEEGQGYHGLEPDDEDNGEENDGDGGDAISEDEDEEIDPAVAARRASFGRRGSRHLHRRASEAACNLGPNDTVLIGYLRELYTSPRHKRVDVGYRFATCFMVLHHFEDALDDLDGEDGPGVAGEAIDASTPLILKRESRKAKNWSTKPRFRQKVNGARSVCRGGVDCEHDPPCRVASGVPGEKVESCGRTRSDGESSGRLSPTCDLLHLQFEAGLSCLRRGGAGSLS